MTTESSSRRVTCLLTHKCSPEIHVLGDRIRDAFRGHDIDVLRDPFKTGEDIAARIETLGIDALLFLYTPESYHKSSWCQRELKSALGRWIPIFTARLDGDVPDELNKRVYPNLSDLDEYAFAREIAALAPAIRSRAALYRRIKALPDLYPEEARKAAQEMINEHDTALLAEFVDQLGSQFGSVHDPIAQYWLVTAIGEARTPQAGEVLLRLTLRRECHPYVLQGMKDALGAVQQELSDHTIAEKIRKALARLGHMEEATE